MCLKEVYHVIYRVSFASTCITLQSEKTICCRANPMSGLITLIALLDWAPCELCFAAEMAHADGSNVFYPNLEMQEFNFWVYECGPLQGTNGKMTPLLCGLRCHFLP